MTYDELHRRSLDDREGFWAEAAEAVLWRKRWTRPLDSGDAPFYRWFPAGTLNTCENAVDRHVADGFGQQPALDRDDDLFGVHEDAVTVEDDGGDRRRRRHGGYP